MRRSLAAAAAVGALLPLLAGGAAHAQDAPKPKYKLQPLNLHKERLGTDAFADAGRARMRNGDCAGALEAFDAALRTAVDPTINRDRGLCHERLGDLYPAMDDYRAYLVAIPDAPDADSIRQRLGALEQQTMGHTSATSDQPDFTPSPAAGGDGTKPDRLEYNEHDHDEMASSLRHGTGFSLGPFFALHKWFTSTEQNIGDGTTWSESVGLILRWSISASGAIFVEGGYEHFNDTTFAVLQGLTSQVGYEFRIPLDYDFTNQFLIAPGVGYEFLQISPNQAGLSPETGGAIVPRLRLGWRHMLTTSSALDLALDGGVMAVAVGGNFLSVSSQPSAVLAALNVGVQWGL